jgi:hypothetical protein
LFADLAAVLNGRTAQIRPRLGEVAAMMRRHAELLTEWAGERRGVTEFRKHVAWYLKGFAVGGELRAALACSSSLAELDDLLGKLDPDEPFPAAVLGRPRGRTTAGKGVALPDGWLASRYSSAVPVGAESDHGGG